jgi:hypothetical protein
MLASIAVFKLRQAVLAALRKVLAAAGAVIKALLM